MPYIEQIYYEASGTGHPVIFIHCPAVSHVYWRPVVERLHHRFRCIAFDLRGHGRTGLGDSPWTFANAAADIALLTRRLQLDRPVLVGYSAGSAIALHAALLHPDAYGAAVVVGGFSECATLSLGGKARAGLAAVSLRLTPLIGRAVVATNHVDREHARAMLPDATRVNPVALSGFLRETLRCNLTPRLHQIQLPVLLAYGKRDLPMHTYLRKLQQRLPNHRTRLFEGATHHLPTTHTDQFAAAVTEFITSMT